MRITLLCVGKLKSGPERDLVDDYLGRAQRLAPGLGLRGILEVEVTDGGGRDREATNLLGKLPKGGMAVRLDEHGPAWSSTELSNRIAVWRDQGVSDLTFLIGGAEGYGASVIDAVPQTLAFGPQTWPHRLVRVMLAEQVYRAATLLAGTPYHKA